MSGRFTFGEMRAEAEREIRVRKQVYPARVGRHGRSSKRLDRQIALMQAIREVLAELEKTEQLLL